MTEAVTPPTPPPPPTPGTSIPSTPLVSVPLVTVPVVTVVRRARFSAAHFYYHPQWSEAENQRVFKACSNRHGHGHNYVLEVAVSGPIDPQTGMVVNLKDLKTVIAEVATDPLEHTHLNHQVAYFQENIPTLENLILYLWQGLQPALAERRLRLHRLVLIEQEDLYVEYWGPVPCATAPDCCELLTEEPTKAMLYLTRTYDFPAAHRLHNPHFSEAENEAIFGVCNNLNGHGHNYILEVTLAGTPDKDTGMLSDITVLDALVKERILDHVDHKHLNLDVAMFRGVNPTVENMVQVFWEQLAPHIPAPAQLVRIRLVESKNNAAELQSALPGMEKALAGRAF
ncbi:MAG: 6-carboxytetrahydropterin synthase [Candidatus Melainabacteria bacterium]|nr:6-carboxytetrahydropterin synthase [Candidatus Melainabacteria bacterium]